MMLVAIPKSASTSLLHTLFLIHSIRCTGDRLPNHPVSREFTWIHKYHYDMRILDENTVQRWTGPGIIYRQHVLPTAENLELLKSHKKVILLRDPHEVVLAYRRGQIAGIHRQWQGFEGCKTGEEWSVRARKIGLLDDLQKFFDLWKDHDGDKLIVTYDQLIADPKTTVNRIQRYFDLPVSENVTLAKKKYTRD